MLYNIGQRVIINSLDAPTYVTALNGHTCIIKRALSSKEREGSVYIMSMNYFLLFYPTTIISSLDLPDI